MLSLSDPGDDERGLPIGLQQWNGIVLSSIHYAFMKKLSWRRYKTPSSAALIMNIFLPRKIEPNFSGTISQSHHKASSFPLSVVTEGSARLFHRYVSYHEPMDMFQKQIIA